MNKKLLLAMSVGLLMYGVSCTTGNDPGVTYTDEQLEEIAAAENYMKFADFKNPETAKKACILGDVEALKKMKRAGFDKLNDSKYILFAAEYGRLECCQYLIENGASINAKDKDDWTVLHWAAKNDDVDLCKYLVEHGADINAKDKDGWTVLHAAAYSGSVDLCKYLIGLGQDVNAKNKYNATVLHSAACSGSVDLCKYLIALGLDVNAKDKDSWTVLRYGAYSGSVDLCKYLIGLGQDVNAKDKGGWTVLYKAAWSGHVELCKYLIENGADVNAKDKYNATVLHEAAWRGSVELCKYLIGLGLDVNAKDDFGYTVLHEAARSGSVELCKYLIEHGVDVNAKDEYGETVLHAAAFGGHVELCKYLIALGLDVNAKDKDNATVLHYAAWSGSVDLCKYLIALGLDVNAKDDFGYTVLREAAWSGIVELCKYLVEHGAEVKGMKVSRNWNDAIKEYLLSKGGILEGTEKKQEEQSADKEEVVHFSVGLDGVHIKEKQEKKTEENKSEQEIEAEFETMKGKFGSTYALYVKLRRYQFLLKKKPDAAMQKKTFAVADEIIRTAPKSQFAEAAKYLKGVIQADQLSDQSEAKAIKEVKKYLEDFIKENPDGLYRGEALMLLGKISLECEWDADATEKYYKMAFDYFQKAGGKQSADPLPEDLKRQVEPTQRMATLGRCYRINYHEEDPLKLYNTANAPAWYADDCKKVCVIVPGTCLYHRGKYDEAKKMWGKIIDLDPDVKQLQSSSIPNLLMRLQVACDEKQMVISEELRHRMSKKLQLPMLWGQVLMLVGQYDASKAIFTKLKSQAQSKIEQAAVLMALGEASNFGMKECPKKDEWLNLGEETFKKVYDLLDGSNTPEERKALIRYIKFFYQLSSAHEDAIPYIHIFMKKYPKDELYPWMLRYLLMDAMKKKNVEETDRLYQEICSMKGTEEIQESLEKDLFLWYGYDPAKKQFYKVDYNKLLNLSEER